MRELVILFVHALATLARLLGPGGIRSVVAESVLVKQQLLILNRSPQRSPNLLTSDRLVAGLCALLIRPGANRPRCGPTGSWSSWINTRAASWGSESMPEPSMVSLFAGCSTTRFEGNAGCRSTSLRS